MSEHKPSDHGPEFWSANCRVPVCLAERRKLDPPRWQATDDGVTYVMVAEQKWNRLQQQNTALRETVERLTNERGWFVAALENVRSAPSGKYRTGEQKYRRCIELANTALAHYDRDALATPANVDQP